LFLNCYIAAKELFIGASTVQYYRYVQIWWYVGLSSPTVASIFISQSVLCYKYHWR